MQKPLYKPLNIYPVNHYKIYIGIFRKVANTFGEVMFAPELLGHMK